MMEIDFKMRLDDHGRPQVVVTTNGDMRLVEISPEQLVPLMLHAIIHQLQSISSNVIDVETSVKDGFRYG